MHALLSTACGMETGHRYRHCPKVFGVMPVHSVCVCVGGGGGSQHIYIMIIYKAYNIQSSACVRMCVIYH